MPTTVKKPKAVKKPVVKKTAAAADSDAIAVGSRVPSFVMPATKIGKVSAAGLKGAAFVIYFYPKDDTSGCTAEACAFSEAMPQFAKRGITVIGVSKDSLASHEKFAKKYNLSFPLASDAETDVCEKFGVWKQKSMYGRTYMGIERSTFLIDGKGVVRAVWRKVSVPGHADDVKKAIATL